MKKLLITTLALASFSFMNAQEEGIRFGAKAGVNIANLTGDDADDLDSKIGFHVGAVVEIPISDVFAFQPELLYSTQGAKFEFSDGLEKLESKAKYNYLNIPLMAKFYVAEGFSLQAGPQIGILLSADIERERSFDVKDETKTIDFGINFGAGYQLESGIFFDARYNLGLTTTDDTDFDGDVKNVVFQISLGYKF